MPHEHVGLFEITCLIIGAAAAVSNILEIILLVRKGKKRTRTDGIILSLSCADTLVIIAFAGAMSVSLASGMKNKRIKKLVFHTLLMFCFNTSVLHILTIAVDRLYSASYPIKYRAIMTKEKTHNMILGIWALSILIVTCFAIPDVLKSRKSLGVYKGVFILASGAVIVISYAYIGYVIWKRGKFISSAAVRDEANCMRAQKQLRDTIFSYAVAIIYIICAFPCAIVMISRTKDGSNGPKIAKLLVIAHSLINPFLYFWKGYYDKCQTKHAKRMNEGNRTSCD